MEILADEFGFDEFQSGMDELFPHSGVSFEGLISRVAEGDITGVFKEFLQDVWGEAAGSFYSMKNIFIWLIVLGVLSALLIHFTRIFDRHQVADMCFYFLYLLLAAVMLKCFAQIQDTAYEAMENIVLFVRLLVPAYLVAVGVTSGTTTVTVYYQLVIVLIYGVEKILMGVVLPLVESYCLLSVINGIWSEGRLTQLMEFLERGITLMLKASLGVVTGISVLQALIAPTVDSMQQTMVKKVIGALPGVGGAAEGIVNITYSSAIVIKNSIGVVLLILLLCLCAVPLLKIFIYAALIKCGAAFMGIVSDRRLTACTGHTADAGLLLFKTTGTAMLLFLISLSVVAASTNYAI
jgi:stage III sporulation protein AE